MELDEEEDIKCSIDQFIDDGTLLSRDELLGKCILCGIKIEVNEDESAECDSFKFEVLKTESKCEQCLYHASQESIFKSQGVDLHLKDETNMLDSRDQLNHIINDEMELVNYKCQICDYCVPEKCDLDNHVEKTHCEMEITRNIRSHLYTSNTNIKYLKRKKFKCHLCYYNVQRKEHLHKHINEVHLKEKNLHCHFCDYSTARKYELGVHIKGVHLKEKNFKCHLCDYSTVRKYELGLHIKVIHLNEKKFQCLMCDYNAHRKSALTVHIKAVHLQEKNFHCHLCDYSTVRKCELDLHIKDVHFKEKNFVCHLYSYSTNIKFCLANHIKGVHLKEKNFKCHLCNYSTHLKFDLNKHIKRVHLKEKKTNVTGATIPH